MMCFLNVFGYAQVRAIAASFARDKLTMSVT
jgi:hypothetical protein